MTNSSIGAPALDGIRIIDLSTVVFGPYATQTLADYGAEVIKIETPDGDGTRYNGRAPEPGMAPLFLGCNRNKKSVVLDLKTEAGRLALLALAETADVFVHNIRPQKLAKLGATPEQLRARNPRLIFAGLLGFGEGGPYAGAPAYDDIIQALSGVPDLMHRHLGVAGYFSTVFADKVSSLMAVHAILAALFQRERSGQGQVIEIPMFESVVSFLLVEHLHAGHLIPRDGQGSTQAPTWGYPRTLSPRRLPYKTADGHLCVMPYTDENWRRFFDAVGRPELAADPRFANITVRTQHITELLSIAAGLVALQPTAYWVELCKRLDIPCAPVNRLEALELDPHLAAVKMFERVRAADDWDFQYARFPVRLQDSQVAATVPPRLGEHTREVLTDLDLPAATLRQLLAGATSSG